MGLAIDFGTGKSQAFKVALGFVRFLPFQNSISRIAREQKVRVAVPFGWKAEAMKMEQ